MRSMDSVALAFKYQFLEAVETSDIKRKDDVIAAVERDSEHRYVGEYLHMLVNIANMLAKENKNFFRFKGKILEMFCRRSDGSVKVFADRDEGLIYAVSNQYGVTSFHHKPAALEKATNWTMPEAPFKWSGFKRQHMALDEALNPKLLLENISQSKPKNL